MFPGLGQFYFENCPPGYIRLYNHLIFQDHVCRHPTMNALVGHLHRSRRTLSNSMRLQWRVKKIFPNKIIRKNSLKFIFFKKLFQLLIQLKIARGLLRCAWSLSYSTIVDFVNSCQPTKHRFAYDEMISFFQCNHNFHFLEQVCWKL